MNCKTKQWWDGNSEKIIISIVSSLELNYENYENLLLLSLELLKFELSTVFDSKFFRSIFILKNKKQKSTKNTQITIINKSENLFCKN